MLPSAVGDHEVWVSCEVWLIRALNLSSQSNTKEDESIENSRRKEKILNLKTDWTRTTWSVFLEQINKLNYTGTYRLFINI